jgi:hypothetical protein
VAGVKGRSGGDRPTAPQNNTGVSATGGAGSKNGQPNRYISGGKYGEGKALMAQQQGATMSAGPAMGAVSRGEYSEPFVRRSAIGGTLLDENTGPIGPITAGVDIGDGPGSEALPKNISGETRPEDNVRVIKKYFPAMLRASQLKDAPDSYKRLISYLSGQI